MFLTWVAEKHSSVVDLQSIGHRWGVGGHQDSWYTTSHSCAGLRWLLTQGVTKRVSCVMQF